MLTGSGWLALKVATATHSLGGVVEFGNIDAKNGIVHVR